MSPTATEQFKEMIDADKAKEGLQLPDNFESIFNGKANKQILVKAAKEKFVWLDPETEKKPIEEKIKTEIQSRCNHPMTADNEKFSVMYLYAALALNNPNPNIDDLKKLYNQIKPSDVEERKIREKNIVWRDIYKIKDNNSFEERILEWPKDSVWYREALGILLYKNNRFMDLTQANYYGNLMGSWQCVKDINNWSYSIERHYDLADQLREVLHSAALEKKILQSKIDTQIWISKMQENSRKEKNK